MDDIWNEPNIVRGLQNGNSDAWAALCNQHSERLWRYVSQLIGSNEAAVADVFQETLLAVARAGRRLRDGSNLWAWLSAIGHNQCALYWRQQSRLSVASLVEDVPAGQPEDTLEQQETITAIRFLLAEMPSDYVVVLTAKYTDGFSANEIATQLGESAEAIRSRLARARSEFRKRYESMTEEACRPQ